MLMTEKARDALDSAKAALETSIQANENVTEADAGSRILLDGIARALLAFITISET